MLVKFLKFKAFLKSMKKNNASNIYILKLLHLTKILLVSNSFLSLIELIEHNKMFGSKNCGQKT